MTAPFRLRSGAVPRALSAAAWVGLAALALAGPAITAAAEPDLPAREGELMARETAFAATMAARDLAAFASFLDEEAVFVGSRAVHRGKAEVVAGWRQYFASPEPPFSWHPEQAVLVAAGDLGLTSGPVLGPDGHRVGTFHSVWRREDGVWKIVLDRGCPPCPCPDAGPGR